MPFDLNALLEYALTKRASDLHLSSGQTPFWRVLGKLERVSGFPELASEDITRVLELILSNEERELWAGGREIDTGVTLTLASGDERFRVNCFLESGKATAAFRHIASKVPSLSELHLPDILANIAHKPHGLFLICGPSGHGKSTTLASMIREINENRNAHIITIEDPIEFVHRSQKSLVHQREVGKDTASFADGARSALRQDPDVIAIGEIRDRDVASAALTAAETGHLVLSTLHAPDAVTSIDRIVDLFSVARQDAACAQLAFVLIGICAQKLIDDGAGGRLCAAELLIATPAVRNCIRTRRTEQIPSLIQTGAEYGMVTFEQALASLRTRGLLQGPASQGIFDR